MMKTYTLLSLTFAACLVACGDPSTVAASEASSDSSKSEVPKVGSSKRITDPAQLPGDQAGLAKAYTSLFGEAIAILEGIETKEQLEARLEQLEELGPAFRALMKRSEDLALSVEEGVGEELNKLSDRMEAATVALFQKFPREAMTILNAFTSLTGGVGRQ